MIYRKKLRYILVESTRAARMKEPHTSDALRNGMLAFMGQLPYFKTNPQVVAQFSDSVFVVSVNRGYERDALLALSFIKDLEGRKLGFYTIRISGTMRSLRDTFGKIYR